MRKDCGNTFAMHVTVEAVVWGCSTSVLPPHFVWNAHACCPIAAADVGGVTPYHFGTYPPPSPRAPVQTSLDAWVDTRRLALWGTSFAGGHVVATGARLGIGNVTAIIAQAPHLSGAKTAVKNLKEKGAAFMLRCVAARPLLHVPLAMKCMQRMQRPSALLAAPCPTSETYERAHTPDFCSHDHTPKSPGSHYPPAHTHPKSHNKHTHTRTLTYTNMYTTHRMMLLGLYDKVRGMLGLGPIYLPIIVREGGLGIMRVTEEELAAYFAKHPPVKQGGWQNMAPARVLIEFAR
jgi:hypothetical protein